MRPFVSAGSPRRVFTPDAFLAPLAGDAPAAGKGAAAEDRGSVPRPWRSGGPPKQGAAFCVFSNVGRDFVPDPVPEAKVGGGLHGCAAQDKKGHACWFAPRGSLLATPSPRLRRASQPRARRRPSSRAQFHRKVAAEKPFRPVGSCHNRLSMRDINPYSVAPRPAPDVDFTLFATGG